MEIGKQKFFLVKFLSGRVALHILMKKNASDVNSAWGGENTFWSREGVTVTLAQITEAIQHIPVVQIPITSLSTTVGWKPTSNITPDMRHPILILNGKIIDGNHRVKYAKDFDIFYVPCKRFTTQDITPEMWSVFE